MATPRRRKQDSTPSTKANEVWMVLPEGNGKSTLTSALALWRR